jgi:hypothetical protein
MQTVEGVAVSALYFCRDTKVFYLTPHLDPNNETHLYFYHYFDQPLADWYYYYPGILVKEYGDAA